MKYYYYEARLSGDSEVDIITKLMPVYVRVIYRRSIGIDGVDLSHILVYTDGPRHSCEDVKKRVRRIARGLKLSIHYEWLDEANRRQAFH